MGAKRTGSRQPERPPLIFHGEVVQTHNAETFADGATSSKKNTVLLACDGGQ
jgi:hypothetical protein